jgi:hypothetical protein
MNEQHPASLSIRVNEKDVPRFPSRILQRGESSRTTLSFTTIRFFAVIRQTMNAPSRLRCPEAQAYRYGITNGRGMPLSLGPKRITNLSLFLVNDEQAEIIRKVNLVRSRVWIVYETRRFRLELGGERNGDYGDDNFQSAYNAVKCSSIIQTQSARTTGNKTMSKKSLYERLGGYDAIFAVTNDLLDRMEKDPQLGRFWQHRGADGVKRERQLIVDFSSWLPAARCTTRAVT